MEAGLRKRGLVQPGSVYGKIWWADCFPFLILFRGSPTIQLLFYPDLSGLSLSMIDIDP